MKDREQIEWVIWGALVLLLVLLLGGGLPEPMTECVQLAGAFDVAGGCADGRK